MIKLCTDTFQKTPIYFKSGNYINLIDHDKLINIIKNYYKNNDISNRHNPEAEYNFINRILSIFKEFYFSDDLVDDIHLASLNVFDSIQVTFLDKDSIPIQFKGLTDEEVLTYIKNSVDRSLRDFDINNWNLFEYLNSNVDLVLSGIEDLNEPTYDIDVNLESFIDYSTIIKHNLLKNFEDREKWPCQTKRFSYNLTVEDTKYDIILEINNWGEDINIKHKGIPNIQLDTKMKRILMIFQLKLWKQYLTN